MKKIIIVSSLIIAAVTFVAFNSSNTNRRMKSYQLIRAVDINSLEREVSSKLNQSGRNWKLVGGISYYESQYIQAVVEE